MNLVEVVVWLLLLIAGGILLVGRQLYHYPGNRNHTFGADHSAARQEVAAARTRLRRVERGLSKELATAQAEVSRVKQDGRGRIKALDAEQRRLRRWEPGSELDRLGPLRLHQHAVVIAGQDSRAPDSEPEPEDTVPLLGLQPDLAGTAPGSLYLYLRPPRGKRRMVEFPPDQYNETRLRAFVLQIEEAAENEEDHYTRRDARLAEIAQERREIKEELPQQVEEADAQYAQLKKAHRDDPELIAARKAWTQAAARWKELTGRAPRL
ncbi:hypothetical protein [Streptomyces radicis]|uniref:Uncharacterized protein n=1 Tax=Streptomyces radicis TaxID=1750517 RepID=A0A3A9WHB0_9ACTN|nr:hypothetical protein [Streptomyces radicis]RKN12408.1 hypothetical protein D7319_00045 [Streptomyces radicis]RKN27822.1 hypothetical protein D7318_02845 [Streptomyces radicis]